MKIEINDPEINVQKIMEQIRENIQTRNYEGAIDFDQLNNMPAFGITSVSMDELLSEQAALNRSWSYSADYHLTSHRKIIGRFIVFGKKVIRKCLRWYMNPVVDHQVQFNATVVRSINQLVDLVRQQWQALEDTKYEWAKYEAQLQQYRAKLEEQLDQLEKRIDAKVDETTVQRKRDALSNEIEKMRIELLNQIARQEEELNRLKSGTNIANNRLRRLERNLKGHAEESYKPSVRGSSEEALDFDYYLFEEYYRGSREEIMDRQKQYLRYFSQGQFVLDLGCGRGEFLELMVSHGIRAEGVELNDDMIAYCRERGFTVHKADLLRYLENVDDNSVDGIFLGQVIEHLQPQQLIRLIRLAHEKLKPNGYFIAETPNPRSLSIFAQSFYMDLTHTKPVHPYTAKFLLESEGYREIEIHYFSPNNEALKMPELIVDGADRELLNQFNQTLNLWHEFIFGEQDYYIAGRK